MLSTEGADSERKREEAEMPHCLMQKQNGKRE